MEEILDVSNLVKNKQAQIGTLCIDLTNCTYVYAEDMALLFDYATERHGVYIDPDTEELVINSIDTNSPFHSIPVRHIHAIVPFEEWVAIVIHSSVIFLNRNNSKVAVDIKNVKPSFMDRLRGISAE